MNIGIYSAASSMSSLEKWQDMTSQNIASSNVPGYKANQMSFEAIRAGMMGIRSQGQPVVTPNMVAQSSPEFNFSAGELQQTGIATNVAIKGEGFFKLQGDGFQYFSRDGEFHVNSENELVNKAGHAVLGSNGPLRVDPRLGEISINQEGEVLQGQFSAGKLSIVDFDNRNELVRVSGGFRLRSGSEAAPRELPDPSILQGSLENSNVSAMREMVNLISISRAFELNHKVIQSLDEIQGKTIEVMGSTG